MKYYRQILHATIISLLLISCSPKYTLNLNHVTPAEPGKYPKFTEKDTLTGSNSPLRSNYDVTFYNIYLDIDVSKKYLKGYVDIYFIVLTDLNKIQIDLYNNMKLNRIVYNDIELKYTRNYNAVFVDFNNNIVKGSRVKITVWYEGSPVEAKKPPWEGGFVWKKDKNKNPWIGVACETEGGSLWLPIKDLISDEPDSMQMNATVPKGLICVSNGMLTDRKPFGDKETFTWKTQYAINSYDITIYIGKFENFKIPYSSFGKTFNLDFYVLTYNLEIAKTHFIQTSNILHFYENTFGEYPWIKECFKLVEGPYAGMENQTAIAYGNDYKNIQGLDFDYIILHESAHEWWGNSVTCKDFADAWIHEGFATYCEALYVEHTKGYKAYLNYIRYISAVIENKRPVIGPSGVRYWDYEDSDKYMKGAITLHTLRNVIENDSLFFNIIKTFYSQHKYSFADTKDFIELVNSMTGVDFNWLFKQYLYSRVCPEFVYKYRYNIETNKSELYYRWTNVGSDFILPVKISHGGEIITIHPSNEFKVIKFSKEGSLYLNIDDSYIRITDINMNNTKPVVRYVL